MILRAKYLIPVDRRPIKDGALRIERGAIAELGPARKSHDTDLGPVLDLGAAAILPGLINAHTHLELTALEAKTPPDDDFFGWLERLRSALYATNDVERVFADAARDGARRSLEAGVTTVGDITSRPSAVRPILHHGPLRVVSFGEVIATGTIRDRLAERLQAAIDGSDASDDLSIAVSPHAPYTIETDGVRACVESAELGNFRMCMHLAETRDEARFTEHGDGPVRDYLRRLGLWDEVIRCPALTPIPFAHACGLLNDRTILAHCNYVSDRDIELMGASGVHVAYCPRTHHAFNHDPHRFRDMLAAGVNVCLGTDSLASNPSLSILAELRFLRRRHADVDGAALLEMATVRGARALGLPDTGRLAPGHRADLTVIPLHPDQPRDPVENILTSTLQPAATFVQGRRVSPRPEAA